MQHHRWHIASNFINEYLIYRIVSQHTLQFPVETSSADRSLVSMKDLAKVTTEMICNEFIIKGPLSTVPTIGKQSSSCYLILRIFK